MKRALFAIPLFVLLTAAAPKDERNAKVDLVPVEGSGVHGEVMLHQLEKGGTFIHIKVEGLHAGTAYSSFYYESSDCSAAHDLFGELVVRGDGQAELEGRIDDDLDEVGSVSVRLGPDYGTLLACANVAAARAQH